MCKIKRVKGVIDRFTDRDLAVILIEEINKEIIIPKNELPQGSEEGTWLTIEKNTEPFKVIAIDEETTAIHAKKTEQLMNKLKNKKRESRFKRK